MSAQAKKHAVDAALAVAEDITAGRLDPDELEAEVAELVRAAAGTVVGPGDPVWPVQVQIARDVLAVGGGIPANELAEWAAVTAHKEGVALDTQKSWIEQALAQYDEHEDSD
jgi:hypothetical protein